MRRLAPRILKWSSRLVRERRGVAALFFALMLPVLLGTSALGLETGSWAVLKVSLQRRADLAAYTAIMRYNAGDTAQLAPTAGVNLAALNGATATNPTWSPSTKTTSASDVSVAMVSGVRNASNTAMRAVVTAAVPLHVGQLFTTQTSITLSATAYGEIMTSAGTGGQPCATALKTSGTGINVQGGAAVNASGCTLRSNAGVSVTNGASITASWVYATSATVSGGSSITNGTTTVTNASGWNNSAPLDVTSTTISDPYASNTAIQNAFSSLHAGTGTAWQGTWQPSTLSPGTYASITSGSGNITLNPGLYIVNGNVSIGNGATVTGNGVTIVTSGTVTFGGGATVTLSAPQLGSTSGAIPGIVLAGNSTSTDTLSNGMRPTLNGVVYYPNGTIAIAGGVNTGNACMEMIAGAISITNGATFGSNCTNYGAATFSSLPGSNNVALVQ
jgi:Flp pilus assembly protein TadG